MNSGGIEFVHAGNHRLLSPHLNAAEIQTSDEAEIALEEVVSQLNDLENWRTT